MITTQGTDLQGPMQAAIASANSANPQVTIPKKQRRDSYRLKRLAAAVVKRAGDDFLIAADLAFSPAVMAEVQTSRGLTSLLSDAYHKGFLGRVPSSSPGNSQWAYGKKHRTGGPDDSVKLPEGASRPKVPAMKWALVKEFNSADEALAHVAEYGVPAGFKLVNLKEKG